MTTYVMNPQILSNLRKRKGGGVVMCPSCDVAVKVGQKVVSRRAGGKGRSRRNIRHYECAQRVGLV